MTRNALAHDAVAAFASVTPLLIHPSVARCRYNPSISNGEMIAKPNVQVYFDARSFAVVAEDSCIAISDSLEIIV